MSGTASAPAPLPQRVFQRLDDRAFLSGEALAADLAVTRAAVWKAVEQLRELGVALDAQTSKGYRLAPGVSALSAERIESLLSTDVRARLEALLVEWTLESTNTRLLEALPPAAGKSEIHSAGQSAPAELATAEQSRALRGDGVVVSFHIGSDGAESKVGVGDAGDDLRVFVPAK